MTQTPDFWVHYTRPYQLLLFFHEEMPSLSFTAKISRQYREEIPLFLGMCYVILMVRKQ